MYAPYHPRSRPNIMQHPCDTMGRAFLIPLGQRLVLCLDGYDEETLWCLNGYNTAVVESNNGQDQWR